MRAFLEKVRAADWIARRCRHRLAGHAARSRQSPANGLQWKPGLFQLVDPAEPRIRRCVKVKAEVNPFDPRWRDYFEDRAFFKYMGIYRHELEWSRREAK